MSATLNLLFVCSNGDDGCPFLAALRAAGFSVLAVHAAKDSRNLLSQEGVSAIAIHQDDHQDCCGIAAELKCAAPQTPLILLRDRYQSKEATPLGVDTVCYADPRDIGLCTAAATFLRLVLDEPGKANRHS